VPLPDGRGSVTELHRDRRGAATELHRDRRGAATELHPDRRGAATELHPDRRGAATELHRDRRERQRNYRTATVREWQCSLRDDRIAAESQNGFASRGDCDRGYLANYINRGSAARPESNHTVS
jgi:hypothetical protein